MATKNSWQPFNSVHYINALCALPGILRYYLPSKDRPVLKFINLAKETRNSGAFAKGVSQQLPTSLQ